MLIIKTTLQRETNKKNKFYQPNVQPLQIPSELKKRTHQAIKNPPKNMSIPLLENKQDKGRKNMLKV